MGLRRIGQWKTAKRILKSGTRVIKPAIAKTLLQEAHFYRKEIVKGIRKQAPGGKAFKPLALNTIRARRAQGFRGTKALIRTGGLRNAITVLRVGLGAFVGVLRTARSKGGDSLMNIAKIHEFGRGPFLVPITAKSRGFLGAAGVQPVPGRVAVVTIVARPFIGPVFKKFGKPSSSKRRLMRRLGQNLRGKFGRVV